MKANEEVNSLVYRNKLVFVKCLTQRRHTINYSVMAVTTNFIFICGS